ncbi:DGQHR domain-containing protein [Paraclostridium sordellii]|uniref:DGQHR domain-containing protein n=1 Tax=Paraclostridium sordellii TaxID=1505 RepID=UPI0005DDA09A|nr:DGQHR domain-containing protein [Paeniclostridium sordellii]CEQ26107.1 DGQHR domain [[Clostridium] sordellii] [Paeniclostridium sordellii]
MIYNAFNYEQNGQKYISLILPFKVINDISQVLVYGKDKYGYQRELSEKHYRDIKNSLINDNIILPTSIILSVNREDIIDKIDKTNLDNIIRLNLDINKKIFRIVDGQHRLKGLEEASKIKEELNEFPLNVIIIITEQNSRMIEVETFSDINSKAKKVQTDLTILAKYNYEILGEKEIDNINEHLCIKVAYNLNEKINDSVWKNAIKFNINSESNYGIIDVNAFKNSISPLVKTIVDIEGLHCNPKDLKNVDYVAEKIADIINKAWNIISQRWSMCFKEDIEKDYDGNFIKIYFNSRYYIQKTTGANVLSMILNDVLQNKGTIGEGLEEFKYILYNSNVKSEDWLKGKKFSGLTSNSGFKKAKNYIINNE